MPLPFGLKVTWFVLSATGCIVCWLVLWAFARSANIKWGPVTYCIGNSFLQISFLLGIIYRMDPFQMPRSFCRAQTILISTGAYIVAGVGFALALATYMTVVKPKTWGDGVRGLRWKGMYAIPVIAFPVIGTAAHAAVVIHLDSAQPSNDMHCDSTAPEWVRMLGYAGLPAVMVLPSLYLSVKSMYRIFKTNQHLQRARPEDDQLTAMPRVSRRYDTGSLSPPEALSVHASSSASGCEPTASAITIAPPSAQTKKFRPFRSSPSAQALEKMRVESVFTNKKIDDADSQISFTFPTFTNPDADPAALNTRKEPINGETVEAAEEKEGTEGGEWEDQASTDEPLDVEHADSIRWDDAKMSPSDSDGNETMTDNYVLNLSTPFSFPKRKAKRPIPLLSPAVWRIIIFQCAYIIVQSLASVTTIIDLCKQRRIPLAFGTQHIAMIMVSWGPIFVFGHIPSVRRNLIPWRPIT